MTRAPVVHGASRTAPAGLTRAARSEWDGLAEPTLTPTTLQPSDTAELPDPVQRWLGRAVDPGTPLRSRVELRMRGQIRLRGWRRFTAVQRLGPGGFVWCARLRLAGLPVVGFDRYTCGCGQMRWRLLGAVPLVSAGGPDVTRSAAGRLAGELLLTVPATALRTDVVWRRDTADRATALVPVGGDAHEVTLTVGPDGALTELVMDRWGDPGGGFGLHRFGAAVHGEVGSSGFTIPRSVTAGWFYGTPRWSEGQFIRYTVDTVAYH